VYFCLKCTSVEEVTKSIILDRIEIHVVLLLVVCLKAEVSDTKEKVKQNEDSGNEAVVAALLQMRGSFCPIPMYKLMNMNPTRLPMNCSSIGTSSPCKVEGEVIGSRSTGCMSNLPIKKG